MIPGAIGARSETCARFRCTPHEDIGVAKYTNGLIGGVENGRRGISSFDDNALTMHYLVDDRGLACDVVSSSSHEGFQSISWLLGIAHNGTRDRLLAAIRSAIHGHLPSIMVWRRAEQILGCMLEIRPAREGGKAVVTTVDLDEPIDTLHPELLVDMLGITRAEAEVAIALFDGDAPANIAVDRGVQIETVRGQIKSLLHKLNLPNQKRLTLLLSRIALSPTLRQGHPPHGGWPMRAPQI